MRAGHDDIATIIQEAGAQEFRKGDVGLGTVFKEPLHFGMAAGGDVADDD